MLVVPLTSCPQSTPNNLQPLDIATKITFKIVGTKEGSGFLIARNDNIYYLLTAKHVIPTVDEFDIVDLDKNAYRVHAEEYNSRVKVFPELDIAIVQFTSNKNYELPVLDNHAIPEATELYVAGFPKEDQNLQFTEGLVVSNALAVEPLKLGYGLIYNNPTLDGMSGGPVLNQYGRVIGMHGRAEQQCSETGCTKTEFNLAIPTQNFLNSILGTFPIRLDNLTRIEFTEKFFTSLAQKLRKSGIVNNCKATPEIAYRSSELLSPDGKTSIYFEGILSFPSKGITGVFYKTNQCDVTKSIEAPAGKIFIKQDGKIIQKDLSSEVDTSDPKIPISLVSGFINPLSFSPDSKYLLIEIKGADIYLRDDMASYLYSSRYNDIWMIDLSNNYQPYLLKDVCVTICKTCTMEKIKLLGFQSESEAVFDCASTAGLVHEIFNLPKRTGNQIFKEFSESEKEYLSQLSQKLPSYGFTRSLASIK